MLRNLIWGGVMPITQFYRLCTDFVLHIYSPKYEVLDRTVYLA